MDSSEREILPWRSLIDESKRFFRSAGQFLEWCFAPDEVCMDIGCGPGDSTTYFIKLYPDIYKLIGIDVEFGRIENAKKINRHDRIEYRAADILNWSSLAEWEGLMSKVVSFYCFHYFKDQRLAFTNVYRLLKPGGSAAICMQLSSPYFDIIRDMVAREEWKNFMKDAEKCIPESHVMKYTSSHYKEILEEIGFEVVSCKEKEKNYTFVDAHECRTLVSAIIPINKSIPGDKKEEFMHQIFTLHREHSNPLTQNELFYLKQCTISILIRKPL